MSGTDIGRYSIVAIVLVGCLVLLWAEKKVPDWLVGIAGLITGNTFRAVGSKK